MAFRIFERDARIASVTMEIVVANTFTNTANLAFVAMVYVLVRRIIVKFALCAEVTRKLFLAIFVDAAPRDRLLGQAEHTHYFSSIEALDSVVNTGLVMAQSTDDP